MKLESWIKRIPAVSTNADPVKYKLTLKAEGLEHEINWLEELLNGAIAEKCKEAP